MNERRAEWKRKLTDAVFAAMSGGGWRCSINIGTLADDVRILIYVHDDSEYTWRMKWSSDYVATATDAQLRADIERTVASITQKLTSA